MALRPIFIPLANYPFVGEKVIEFKWYPGLAKSQAQKSIQSLHNSAANQGITPILEISSKSQDDIGIALSAFNLKLRIGQSTISVECAYQGSKVFTHGGPFSDLYFGTSVQAKKDERIRNSGKLIRYSFFEESFPVEPITLFYNWLYLNALAQNNDVATKLLSYKGFSDIAFNPKTSSNCQARAAALYVSLYNNNKLDYILQDKSHYIDLIQLGTCEKVEFTKMRESMQVSQLELPLRR